MLRKLSYLDAIHGRLGFELVPHPFYCTGAVKTNDSDSKLSSQSRFGQADAHFYCTGTAKTNFLHRRGVFEKPQKTIKKHRACAEKSLVVKTFKNWW